MSKQYSKWVEMLKAARKTALVQDGKRKIHFTLADGTELCEEYDVKTNDLLIRKWRHKSTLGASKPWEVEIGEPDVASRMAALTLGSQHLIESNANPVCVRLDTRRAFQWRIRNLPYPIKTYDITVDSDEKTIVVRTTNKKYFKKLNIPDMERRGLKLDSEDINIAHANNTLIIQYQKPKCILDDQALLLAEFKNLKTNKEGDMECNQS